MPANQWYVRFIYVGFVISAIAAPLLSQVQVPIQQRSIKQIFAEDQKARANFMKFSSDDLQKMTLGDARRREEVRQLLAHGGVVTGEDFREASFVFQHGDKPEDFLLAHVLAVAAVAKGDVTAAWISAATLDRYLQSVKQPQVFGTQYNIKDLTAVPRVVTQAPYDKEIVSDALRKVFCVAPSAVQQKNLAAMNKGQDLQGYPCH